MRRMNQELCAVKRNQPATVTSRPSWPGRLLGFALLLSLLLVAAVLTIPHTLPWFLQQQGIDFQWRNPRWHLDGFSATQLQLTLPGDDAHPRRLTLENLSIHFAWQALRIEQLQASHVQIQWSTSGDQAPPAQANQALLAAALKWVPQHITLPDVDARLSGVGHLQGSLTLDAGAPGQRGPPALIDARFTLQDLQGAWLERIPAELRPGQLHARISTRPNPQDDGRGRQLLTLDAGSDKAWRLQLTGLLDLQQAHGWQAALDNAKLSVELGTLTNPALRAEHIQVQARLSAQADSKQFAVHFSEPSSLEARKLQSVNIGQAEKMTVQLAGLTVQGRSQTPDQIEVHGPLKVRLDALAAGPLYPQRWDFQGTLEGPLPQLELKGALTGQYGLSLDGQMRLLGSSLDGSAAVKEIFFKAGTPLQRTFKSWPALVSFSNGRLLGRMDFSLPSEGPLALSLNGSANGLDGIINRSELENLTMQFKLRLSGQTLQLDIPGLTIAQLNPGIPLGSIQLANAHYRASLKNPRQGMADWQSVKARLLDGTAWLGPQKLDLKRADKVLLHVEGLQLQTLLKIYPAEGLAGTGIIDGQIPIHIDHDTFYVEAGQLQARQPGVLQFHSDRIRALGESNPTMRLVADALEDFHFNVLSSAVSYDQSGKLLLNIRLEGRNPDVEKGRPIHLNLNLEEDIPALLASIQLSSHISEVIQNRILERLKKR